MIKFIVRFISVITIMLSGVWFYSEGGFEPLITTLAGIAGLISSLFVKTDEHKEVTEKPNGDNMTVETEGDQSSAVNAGRDVTITYGISEAAFKELHDSLKGKNEDKVIARLLATLDEKDVAIETRDAQIHEWIARYNELEERFTKRSTEDTYVAQAKVRLTNGDLTGAEKLLRESLGINLKAINERQKAAASDAYELGSLKELQFEYQESKNYFEQAVQLDPRNTIFLIKCGLILRTLADYKKAIEYFDKALKIDLKVHGDKHPMVAIAYNNIGVTWKILGDSKKAIEYFEKALKIDLEVYGDQHPTVAINYSHMGSALHDLGDFKKAIEYHEKSLKIDIEVFGDKHPKVSTVYNNIGLAWNDLKDSKKAIEYFDKALKIDLKVYGDQDPTVATVYGNIGLAWNDLKDSKKAIEYYEKALKIDLKVYGNKHPSVACCYNNIGSAWDDLKDSKRAIEYHKKALEIALNVYGDRHPKVAISYSNIGSAWKTLGDFKEAIVYYKKALTILDAIYGSDHPHTKKVKTHIDEIAIN